MNVLSIDWDYFFPDLYPFDWSHSEEAMFYMEALWAMRANNRPNMDKNAPCAAESVHPTGHQGFLEQVCKEEPIFLWIVESHKDIVKLLEQFVNSFPRAPRLNVWNFDQHHDLYYGEPTPIQELNCGNWVQYAIERNLIQDYHLIYPEWRKDHPEGGNILHTAQLLPSTDKTGNTHLTSVYYGFDMVKNLLPDDFDHVFICRSSAWTPPWADAEWFKFLSFFHKFDVWNRKVHVPYVMDMRSPNKEEAIQFAKEQDKAIEELMVKRG